MGSDRIKDELVRGHPGTRSADWKRRTRTKGPEGVHRRFEHADGRTVDTIERADGSIELVDTPAPGAPKLAEYPGAVHSDVEIFVAGPQVDALAAAFDDSGDNPDIVALFRPGTLHTDGEYDGDGCDRLEIQHGILWAAMDGLTTRTVAEIAAGCRACAERNPDLSYMVAAAHPVDDDEIQRYDVLLLKGFDATNNPMKRLHGRFYADFVVRGI